VNLSVKVTENAGIGLYKSLSGTNYFSRRSNFFNAAGRSVFTFKL
jgi:hypothetical protein